jgi:CBS domain-containing protein
MLERTVGEIIGKQTLVRLSTQDSVAEGAKAMTQRHIGCVLVCDEADVCGIVTERDVLDQVVAAGRDPQTTRLGEIMSSELRSIRPDNTAMEALRTMGEVGVRHLPVVAGGGVAGIVSVHDLLRSVVEEMVRDREFLLDMWEGIPA